MAYARQGMKGGFGFTTLDFRLSILQRACALVIARSDSDALGLAERRAAILFFAVRIYSCDSCYIRVYS